MPVWQRQHVVMEASKLVQITFRVVKSFRRQLLVQRRHIEAVHCVACHRSLAPR